MIIGKQTPKIDNYSIKNKSGVENLSVDNNKVDIGKGYVDSEVQKANDLKEMHKKFLSDGIEGAVTSDGFEGAVITDGFEDTVTSNGIEGTVTSNGIEGTATSDGIEGTAKHGKIIETMEIIGFTAACAVFTALPVVLIWQGLKLISNYV